MVCLGFGLKGSDSLWKVRQLVHRQEAETDGYSGAQLHFPLLIQPWTPARRKRSPTFRVGLPSSPDPHRHVQRLVCLLGEARFCQVDSRY